MVARYDVRGEYKAKKLDNGHLVADATLTRAGVFTYRRPDGTMVRELRHPDEVFKADSLDSLSLVPVTDGHPAAPLDSTNTRALAVGTVGETIKRAGDFVQARLRVTDSRAVQAVESGVKQQLSCGYVCDVEDTPGVWQGQAYDAVQKNISYNHVALVTKGRAGEAVRIHMDAADAVMLCDDLGDTSEHPQMAKVRIDGVDFDAPEGVAQAFAKFEKAASDRAETAEKAATEARAEIDKVRARADAAEEQAKALKGELEAAHSPAAVQKAVTERLALERVAVKVLGAAPAADMSNDAIKRAVVAKRSPGVKLDSVSPEYLQGRFDFIADEATSAPHAGLGAVQTAATAAAHADGEDPIKAALARQRARFQNAWKEAK